jgi:hypothetical protein
MQAVCKPRARGIKIFFIIMNKKDIFNKAYAKAQERILENDIVFAHIGEGSACKINYVQKIYDAAILHPHTTVKKILENLNVSMTQYKNMKMTHMSIPEYRRQNLGRTRVLLQSEKDVLASNLKIKSKTSNDVKKKSKSKTKHSGKYITGGGYESDEADKEYLRSVIYETK